MWSVTKHLNCSSEPENDLFCGDSEIWKLSVEYMDVPGKGRINPEPWMVEAKFQFFNIIF